ncbi:MAG: hypothetical protein D6698_04010 [Gammaproteobacteria bacterium]|nr:MAG: hypothetical protein D6698_04010 [Gammaproteobacteria bacterium]
MTAPDCFLALLGTAFHLIIISICLVFLWTIIFKLPGKTWKDYILVPPLLALAALSTYVMIYTWVNYPT